MKFDMRRYLWQISPMDRKVSEAKVSEETFDDFLAEQGVLEEAENVAISRVLAWQTSRSIGPPAVHKSLLPV